MTAGFRHLLTAGAERLADRVALVSHEGRLTRRQLDHRAAVVAARLVTRGVKPGDRLALKLPNGPELAVGLLAGWTCGATVAPLDPLLGADETRAILADLSPAAVLDVSDVIVATSAAESGPSAPHPVEADAPALVLYTSGSTGRPKGAVLSHAAVEFANRSWAEDVMALTADDVVLAALPLSHSYGLNGALLAPLLVGARVVVLERFTPEAALEAIARERVTLFPGVATMFHRILESGAFAVTDLRTLRLCVSGAAPLPWELACRWRERTGIRILRGYGMTELFRPLSYLARDPLEVPDAVGRPVPGVEIRLSEDGELLIRSPCAMQGYMNSPEETREALRDGWFYTGDLATLTPEGLVKIVGRKRERILRGGYSVFPAEVEAVLLTHPAVAGAAVVGVPHAELGEEVAAFVTLRPGAALEPNALVDYSRERLAGFKYPRRVTVLDAFPKSATGKILKTRLG